MSDGQRVRCVMRGGIGTDHIGAVPADPMGGDESERERPGVDASAHADTDTLIGAPDDPPIAPLIAPPFALAPDFLLAPTPISTLARAARS